MKPNLFLFAVFAFSIFSIFESFSQKLPEPQKNIGKPLMEVFSLRHSSREFSSKDIPLQDLSNLLWSANGINRTETGKRTAPSAMNWQEIDVYVIMQKGAFLYNAKEHSLNLISDKDLRAFAGTQDFVKTAPLNFIYVANMKKIEKREGDGLLINIGADAGFIGQNVYLYCASQGFNVVIRASIKKDELAKELKLTSDQQIILGQTIGFAPEK